MKMVLSLLPALGCVVLLAGCATAMQPYQPAQQIAATTDKYTLGTAPVPDDYMHRFIDTKHSELYMQNQGGGGAAVGVLLGPIGVLANVAAIKKQTETDSTLLQNKLPIDVQHLFVTSMAGAPTVARVEGNATAPSLAPLLYVVKLDDAHIRFASLVYVKSAFDGKPWSRQYVYELPDSYGKDELARGLSANQLARLAADAEAGFQWIAATYLSDVSGTFHPQQKSVIHSDFVTPRFQIAYNGYRFDPGAGRVGFVMGRSASSTIYSLPDDAATVTDAK
jgi:hypothetical protein